MSDDFDRSQELQIEANERAVALQRSRPIAESHPDFNGEDCAICEVQMPKERLALGKVLCITCQSIKERKAKLQGG